MLSRSMSFSHTLRTARLLLALVASLSALEISSAPALASGSKLTHAQATSQLRAAGISWSSSGNCSNRYNPHCTSFEQINSGTIGGIIAFKQANGCPVNITGGTEVGHASGTYSHYNGYKVDIGITACATNWITHHYTYIGIRSDGAHMYKSAAGNIYANEGSHWDILYY